MDNRKARVPMELWSFNEATSMVASKQPKVDWIVQRTPPGRALDLGCNDGGIADQMARRGAYVIGADTLPYVQVAHRKYRLPAVALDANSPLPFADGAFDGVVISGLLEYLNTPAALLVEVRRVLSPAGRLVLVIPNKAGALYQFNRIRRQPSMENRFGRSGMTKMLRAAGFAILEHRPCSYRLGGLRGSAIYTLERILPLVATDLAFLCCPAPQQ
jgi:SAM-dependent methyltransferase